MEARSGQIFEKKHMVAINAGDLREKVSFYTLTRTADGAGGYTATEVLNFETLASVKPSKAARSIENGKLVYIQPYKVSIRYAASHTVTIDMLMKYRGNTYQIIEITDADVMRMLVNMVVVRSV
jgi:head-tail adaptor